MSAALEGDRRPVKCPKCGFVSYPGLAQCKKCGHRFRPESGKGTSGLLSLFSGSAVPSTSERTPDAPPSSSPTDTPSPSTASQTVSDDNQAGPPEPVDAAATGEEMPGTETPVEDSARPAGSAPGAAPSSDLRPWREELSQRVENFRRRRAYLRQSSEPGPNLDFDFQATGEAETETVPTTSGSPIEGTRELYVTREPPDSAEVNAPILDALPLDTASEPDNSAWQAFEESPLGEAGVEPRPAEIVLEPLPPLARPAGSPPASLLMPQASLGRRFLAGLADGLVLLLAMVLFGFVFWRAGGHMSLRPANILVLGVIAALFILVYFGMFTAFISSTPGLLWMGLEIRNLEGDHASPRQAAWRAFGYLVSVAGLMLGFIWALVDTDTLTWHDRISGTFLTVTHPESG